MKHVLWVCGVGLLTTLVMFTEVSSTPAKDETTYSKDVPATEKDFPPGWFPLTKIGTEETWQSIRDSDEKEPKIRLYIPPNVKTCRGVFFSFQFHSSDPRQCADLWDFALVTVPFPLEYDIGVNDKRSGRYKLGHPAGNMGYLLKYLELAAKETKHTELANVPIVGWLMQNGVRHLKDLYERAPERVIAWSDGWPNQMKDIESVTKKVPFAYAWELGNDVKERETARTSAGDSLKDKLTPPATLACRASTYGFKHGVYSKYGFFVAYLDRCIKTRLPAEYNAGGKLVALKPYTPEEGWVSDFNPVSEWVPIAPYKEAKGMISPVWLPDEYMAWVYRAYHSANPDLKLVAPVTEYRGSGKRDDCGIGYSPISKANEPVKLVATAKGDYKEIEFRDGNKLLGTAKKAPYELDGIKFEAGMHALIVVGVKADDTRVSSHPAFYGVK